jgi:hypothetical protein
MNRTMALWQNPTEKQSGRTHKEIKERYNDIKRQHFFSKFKREKITSILLRHEIIMG